MGIKNSKKGKTLPGNYVVSSDIEILLGKWAKERQLKLPDSDFFAQIRREFETYMKTIFAGFHLIPEDAIRIGINKIVKESGLVPVSLDRVYFDNGGVHFDVTRMVDEDGNDIGIGPRHQGESMIQQTDKLDVIGNKGIVLVDDVIFSGDLLVAVTRFLTKHGYKIELICAGVAIRQGVDKLKALGYKVEAGMTYEHVIDEVCERDFYPGVPFSGRLLDNLNNIGVPYLLPFGKLDIWASIPLEYTIDLSKFCIKQTIRIFTAIEKASNKEILCGDLDRGVIGYLPMQRFVAALEKSMKEL